VRRALAVTLTLFAAVPLLAQNGESDIKTATEYVVKPGETLGGIANRAEVPRVLIIEANGLKAPYALKAGQKLVIPRRRSHTVKDGETGLSIALDYGVPWSAVAQANGIDPKAPIKPGQKLAIPTMTKANAATAAAAPTPSPSPGASPSPSLAPALPPDTAKAPAFAWPYQGGITREFAPRGGKKAFHDGIDIAGDKGEAVRAAAAGKVIFAGQGPKEYGLTVIVYHSGRWTTTYAFLDKVTVKEGEKVKSGERVGKLGATGLAKQPSLHFEIRRNRVALDPVKYLPAAESD
jgi:murein DD-endopeptidase MepM/ murein hydrolase activator NlpD